MIVNCIRALSVEIPFSGDIYIYIYITVEYAFLRGPSHCVPSIYIIISTVNTQHLSKPDA